MHLKLLAKEQLKIQLKQVGIEWAILLQIRLQIFKKKPASEPHSNAASSEIPKERYISPQERQKIMNEVKLI